MKLYATYGYAFGFLCLSAVLFWATIQLFRYADAWQLPETEVKIIGALLVFAISGIANGAVVSMVNAVVTECQQQRQRQRNEQQTDTEEVNR